MISLLQLLRETQTQKILVPRRSSEERAKNHIIAINRQIQEYIKNGSKGDLDLGDTPIKQLPSNLVKVGGYLYLYNTKIEKLPDNLKVGGGLYLYKTPITQLPDNLKVGGYLDLRNTQITQLPDNLEVGGYLDLWNTPITQLPDNLQVGGYILVNYSKQQYFKDKYPQYTDKIR